MQLSQVVTKMSSVYGKATVCKYGQKVDDKCDKLTLDPEISDRFAHSRDFDELKYYWKEWRDNSGKKMRDDYKSYVQLMNQAARANNFTDAAEWYQARFEDNNFNQNIDNLWLQVKPLYDDLHTYTKYKLIEIYGMRPCDVRPLCPNHLSSEIYCYIFLMIIFFQVIKLIVMIRIFRLIYLEICGHNLGEIYTTTLSHSKTLA